MHVFGNGVGTNSLYERQGLKETQGKSEAIQLDTLDAYCEREKVAHIDILKIDVEGHEGKQF
jgi:FkbM family methyltransferase